MYPSAPQQFTDENMHISLDNKNEKKKIKIMQAIIKCKKKIYLQHL